MTSVLGTVPVPIPDPVRRPPSAQPHTEPGAQIDEQTCRLFQTAVELAGRKWSAAVLLAAARGAQRFGELRTLVQGISDRVLSARLKELEHHELIERTVIPTTPVQVLYHLTPRGQDLIDVLQPVVDWGIRWGLDGGAPPVDRARERR